MTRAESMREAQTLAQTHLSRFHLGDEDIAALALSLYSGQTNALHWAFKRKPGNRKWCPCNRGECVAIREMAKVLPAESRPALRGYQASL